MSDSDDTDVLLLIPPDFFVAETASSANSDFMADADISPIPIENSQNFNYYSSHSFELKQLNREILKLEQGYHPLSDNITSNSSFCKQRLDSVENCSFFSDCHRMSSLSPSKLHHSTPKNTPSQRKLDFLPKSKPELSKSTSAPPPLYHNQNFLKEIDGFLHDNNSTTNNNGISDLGSSNVHALASEALRKHNSMLDAQHSRQYRTEYQDNLNSSKKIVDENKTQLKWPKNNFNLQHNGSNPATKPLISLCDIWGPEGQTEIPSLHEERLRREHCEKQIQSLQVRLLEYQQKISVAIKIDKSKDEAIAKLHATNQRQVF